MRHLTTSLVLLGGLAACGGEAPVQAFEGQLSPPTLGTLVQALRGDALVASSPVDPQGRFLLVLPLDSTTCASLIIADTPARQISEALWVCTATQSWDLGRVAEYTPPQPDCVTAQANLRTCISMTTSRCQGLADNITTCRSRRDAQCTREQAAFDGCRGTDQCTMTERALRSCHEPFRCEEMVTSFDEVCTRICRAEENRVDVLCTPPPDVLPLGVERPWERTAADCVEAMPEQTR